MSEREFELYLSVLSRLLGLSPAQRSEIADELRDDLESRFHDLCSEGHSRETAIQMAIEELGDVSGLAGHFTRIARQRRRKTIMRYSLTTTAVLVVAFIVFNALGPVDHPDLEGPQTANAHFGGNMGGGGMGGGGFGGPVGLDDYQMGIRLFSKPRPKTFSEKISIPASADSDYPKGLKEVVALECEKLPLSMVLEKIIEATGVPIFVDHRSLDDDGVDLDDILITCDERLAGWQLLNTICRLDMDRSIGWHFRHDTVWIRSESVLWDERHLQTISYDIGQLLSAGVETDTVVEMVGELSGGLWEAMDGEGGSVVTFGPSLSVKTTSQVHQRIGTMLAALGAHASKDPPQQTQTPAIEADLKLDKILEQKVSLTYQCKFLDSVLSELKETYGVPVRVDRVALEEEGLDPASFELSLSVKDQPLGRALAWMLEPLDLVTVVTDGNVWITTITEKENSTSLAYRVVFYNVREILPDLDDATELIGTVQTVVDGQWYEEEGQGGNMAYSFPGILMVKQTAEAHGQITALLDFYRRNKPALPASIGVYAGADDLELRMYQVGVVDPENLLKIIPEFVSPESWSGQRGSGSIQVIKRNPPNHTGGGHALVIRQTRAIHREIAQFLKRMGEQSPNGGHYGQPGGGGFF